MTKFLLLTPLLLFSFGCANKHGISAKYYSDCKEYYDLQGFYHKECGKDDIATYKEIKESSAKAADKTITTVKKLFGQPEPKPKPQANVW